MKPFTFVAILLSLSSTCFAKKLEMQADLMQTQVFAEDDDGVFRAALDHTTGPIEVKEEKFFGLISKEKEANVEFIKPLAKPDLITEMDFNDQSVSFTEKRRDGSSVDFITYPIEVISPNQFSIIYDKESYKIRLMKQITKDLDKWTRINKLIDANISTTCSKRNKVEIWECKSFINYHLIISQRL